MTKSKQTKRALFSSALALILCFTMLLGTTFAWFTDTVSTNVNRIQSGKLEVDLQDENGDSLVGGQLLFKNADDTTDILWEPGATFETGKFKVVSTGNLALQYKIELNGVKVSDNKLMEVIKFKIVDESGTVDLNNFEGHLTPSSPSSGLMRISATMDSNAGNEYQNLEYAGVSITIYAAQDTVEKDINDDQYDVDATYDDEVAVVNTADEFLAAMENLENGTIVSLGADIDMAGKTWAGVTNKEFTLEGNNHKISNLTNITGIEGKSKVGGLANSVGAGQALTIRNLTLENVTVTSVLDNGYSYAAAIAAYCDAAGAITLENVKVTGANIRSAKYAGGLIAVNGGYNDDSNGPVYCVTNITNCSVEGTIQGDGSAGGAIGHCGWNAATKTTITNFTCTETVNGEDNQHTGSYIGTVGTGDLCEIDAAYSDGMIGRYVPGGNTNSKLICNGVEISAFQRTN